MKRSEKEDQEKWVKTERGSEEQLHARGDDTTTYSGDDTMTYSGDDTMTYSGDDTMT